MPTVNPCPYNAQRPTWKQRAVWFPRLWLRFQLNYLRGFPCIMGIALLYAHYIGFDAFNPS